MKFDKTFNKTYTNVDSFIADNAGGLPSEGELTKIYNELPDVFEYDSKAETLEHIKKVNNYLIDAATILLNRAKVHDDSKLSPEEKKAFDLATPKLKSLKFGTEAYQASLDSIAPALDHHYKNNTHHPQHFPNGIDGMDLFDLIEMFMDWKAAGERTKDGNIISSIVHNKDRFRMSEQLTQIFFNTAKNLKYDNTK